MKNPTNLLKVFAVTTSVIGTFPFVQGEATGAESQWVTTMGAKLRLIAQSSVDDTRFDAGLQIELEPGWKTYWRSPGSSGLPPQLSLAGSTNVAGFKVLYPVPNAYDDASGRSAGYKGNVTFPIAVEQLFPGQATTLKLSGMLGVCKEICVPVPFDVTLDLGKEVASSAPVARTLLAALTSLPQPAKDTMGVHTATLSEGGQVLTATGRLPEAVGGATLFVASPAGVTIDPLLDGKREGDTITFQKRFMKPLKPADREGKWVFLLKVGAKGLRSELPIQ